MTALPFVGPCCKSALARGKKLIYFRLADHEPPVDDDCGAIVDPPGDIPKDRMVLEAHGAVIGQSRAMDIDGIVFVVPGVYGQMTLSERYSVARLMGRIVHPVGAKDEESILLTGRGRWGTTRPWLGVPVSFAEINRISALCGIVAMREELIPDVSLGTHFFNDLVETDILYMALFPNREDNLLNAQLICSLPNRLGDYLDDAEKWEAAARAVESKDLPEGRLRLNADILKQGVLVCITDGAAPAELSERT